MAISFSGVGSGLPVSEWVNSLMSIERQPTDKLIASKSVIQNSKLILNTLQGKFSTLRSNIDKIADGNLSSSLDLFKKMQTSTSNNTMATATATSSAVPQSIKLRIESLATSTKVQSGSSVAKAVAGDTKISALANGTGKVGDFSIYVDGKKEKFTVDADSTLASISSAINDRFSTAEYGSGNITASISADGKFKINVARPADLSSLNYGSSSDTSNFFNITQFTPANTVEGKPNGGTSGTSLSLVNTTGTLVGNKANLSSDTITAGTFTIGKKEFKIDENSSISSIVNKINSEADAGVTAQFDVRANKLTLLSKTPGQTTINLEKGTSGFLEAMGLLDSSGKIITSTQALGNKAKVYINDSATAIEVNSNTLSEDISGIPGLTVNLLKITKDTDKGTDSVDIGVTKDNSQLVTALNNFLSKYNEINAEIDKQTASTGQLKNESGLQRIKSDLRNTVTKSVVGLTKYNSLSSIGVTTGAVGASISSDVKTFSLDQNKLQTALANNPEEVRALLLGDGKNIKGIFQTLKDKVASTLSTDGGYFKSKSNSIDSNVTQLTKTIESQELRLTKRREILSSQFQAMDSAIAQMKSQSESMTSLGF